MKSNPQLRIVNDVPSQTQDSGVSVKTVVMVAALTAIASQLAVDGYRYFKKKFQEKRKELASNPEQFSWPIPEISSSISRISGRSSNPETALSEEDLREWERDLREREANLQTSDG